MSSNNVSSELSVYNYSARPLVDYLIPGLHGKCEVGAIRDQDKSQAIWNLFFLSIPSIDNVPDSTQSNWFDRYTPTPGAATAVTSDVVMDEVMYRKVMMHPARFVAWFHREDVRMFDCYQVLGGARWRETVIKRAQAASERLAQWNPQIARHDNVVDLCLYRNNKAA